MFAVNKMYVGDWDGLFVQRIGKSSAERAQTMGIDNYHLVPISALKGDNVVEPSRNTPWYDGPPLLSLLETLPVAATPVSPSPRFFVQWVIRHGGSQVDDFRGYAGQIGRASCRERVCQYV